MAAPTTGVATGAAAATRAKKMAIGGGGAILGVLALLALLWKSGIFGVQADNTAPVLIKHEQAPPPALAKTAEVVKMPDDIHDWLKHLEKIEDEKKELLRKQIADLKVFEEMIGALGSGIGSVNPYDQTNDDQSSPNSGPADLTKGKFEDLRPQWEALLQEYQSVPPPEECKPIADSYETGLESVPDMIGEVNNVLNQVNSDPSSALKEMNEMQNKSYATVDKPFAEADEDVQAICDKYQTPKWFNIGDVGETMFSKGM